MQYNFFLVKHFLWKYESISDIIINRSIEYFTTLHLIVDIAKKFEPKFESGSGTGFSDQISR